MAKAASKARVRMYSLAQKVVDAEDKEARKARQDSRKLVERTMDYLKSLGLVKN